MIRLVLIIDDDQDRPLIAKFVLVRILLGDPPRQPGVGRDERVALFIRGETVPDVAYGHDEPRSGRGEHLAIVVRLGDGPEV